LLVLLAAQFGDPGAPGRRPVRRRLRAHPPGDALPRRRHGRGVAAPRRSERQLALEQHRRDPHRRLPLRARLRHPRRPRPEAVRIQARTFERLVVGQIRETVGPQDGDDPIEHYLSVVADKTGSLIATSSRFGALLAGADEAVVDILARFGERIGVAFQLSDDILDVASESSDLGKTPGTDLREGIATLPVLYMRRAATGSDADQRLSALLDGDLADDALHAEALRLLRAHPAMEEARAELRRWAEDARTVLEPLPDAPAKAGLRALCDVVVSRTG
jgi:heptaprenyl diphosphate synthase